MGPCLPSVGAPRWAALLSRKQGQQTSACRVPAGGDLIWGAQPPLEPAKGPPESLLDLLARERLNKEPQTGKKTLPGAMRRGSRRCPQRPGLPLRGATVRPRGVHGCRWNPRVGIGLSSLEAEADTQTGGSSTLQLE